MKYKKMGAEIYTIVHNMDAIERKLSQILQTSKTKAEMQQIAKEAMEEIKVERNKIDQPRSAHELKELSAGDAKNTIVDELYIAVDDLGTALYHLANGKIKDAEKIIANVKDVL